jgi:ligand-binding sensor domain-containing protein
VLAYVSVGSKIWFATYGQGILEYDKTGNIWSVYSTQANTSENDFFYCIAVSNDFIWAGGADGLYIYDRKNSFWKKRKFAGGDYGNWVRALYYDAKTDILWIGKFIGLTKLHVRAQKYEELTLTRQGDDRTNNFRLIAPDGDDKIYFGVEGGFFVLDKRQEEKDQFAFYNSNVNGFPVSGDYVALSGLLSDKDYLWAATQEFISNDKPNFNLGGLFRFNRRTQWTKFSRESGLPANGIQAIAKIGEQLWFSLYAFDKNSKVEQYKGLYMMNPSGSRVARIDLDDIRMTTMKIQVLHFDGKYLWIGTDSGLWKILLSNPFAEWTAAKTKRKKE